jgi:hypothetical protein
MVEEHFWRTRARREALRFNGGWVLQAVLPWILGVGLALAFAVFLLRMHGGSSGWLWGGSLAILGAGVGISLWRGRGRWIGVEGALEELDAAMGMRGALMAACDGACAWPKPAPDARLRLHWNFRAIARGPALVFAALGLAAYLPLPPADARAEPPTEGPAAWAKTRALIDTVREARVADTGALDATENELSALANNPPEDWFSPAGLEAADHLLDSFSAQSRELGTAVSQMLAALQSARASASQTPPDWQQTIEQAREAAMSQLASAALPADPELLEALKSLDTSRLRSLSAGEWAALRERLEAGAMACGAQTSTGQPAGDGRRMSGNGGINRGPGSEPSLLGDAGTAMEPARHEALSNPDFRNALPGDILGTSASKPKEDASTPLAEGGSIAAGAGAGALAPLNTTPAEQSALRAYFQ